MRTVGEVIKQRRTQLGVEQRQLAAQVGVTVRQIGRWENGEQEPTASSCQALARALNLTLAQLFGQVPIGLDLSGKWFAAWQTSRQGAPVIDRHTLTAEHAGDFITLNADGDYLWSGDLRTIDGSLFGTYRATEHDRQFRGALYFTLSADLDAAIGRWSGLWADGIVGGGWGVLARDTNRAGRLLDSVIAVEGPLTEWPRED